MSSARSSIDDPIPIQNDSNIAHTHETIKSPFFMMCVF